MPTARLVTTIVCALLAVPSAARAQDYVQSTPRTYYLHGPSSYQQGCWGPCACLLSAPEVMRGSFTLGLITVGDATDFYSITGINWNVPTLLGQPVNMALTGAGTFGAGQVPFSTHQSMSLDLTLAPAPPGWNAAQHFDTTPGAWNRTVPPPVIDMEVANSTTGCPGIRLRIVASWYQTDWNADGTLGVSDIFAFLNDWLAGNRRTDFDGVGGVTVADVFAFINAWFAGA